MGLLAKKTLLDELKKISKANLHGLDSQSFSAGYANGYVRGYNKIKKWVIVLAIALCVSLIFNFFI